jgi:hypothetical protein
MAAAAAQAPEKSAPWGGNEEEVNNEPAEVEDEADEVARLQAMMDEQNAEWQK